MPKIALAQVTASTDRAANLERALELIGKAAADGAELICFPEMGFGRFFPQYRADPQFFDWAEPIPGPTVERLQQTAQAHKIGIVANIFERADHGIYYNCSPIIGTDGELLGRSRMAHIAEAPYFNEKFYYHPGDGGFRVYEVAGVRIGIAICYDRHYPEQLRTLALRGCEILFVPLAAVSREQWAMFEMELQVASFQNQYFSVVVNRAGQEEEMDFIGRSFVTDPYGQVVMRLADGEADLQIIDIDPSVIDTARRVIPHFRDRRPELYRQVAVVPGQEDS